MHVAHIGNSQIHKEFWSRNLPRRDHVNTGREANNKMDLREVDRESGE